MRHVCATFTLLTEDGLHFCGLSDHVALPARHVENVRSGMPALLTIDQTECVHSLYLIRQDGRPEQVWGPTDDLLDVHQVEDKMVPYTPIYRMCRHLLGALYDDFHIREMLEQETALRRIEEQLMRQSLQQEADWRMCRGIAIDACREALHSMPLRERALARLEKVSSPRKHQMAEPIALNLLGYPAERG